MAAKEFSFRGHFHFPLSLSGATTFAKDQAGSYYSNNEAGEGGWYPVGANQMWHNGIHLETARGTPVRSMAGGRLVAARLGLDYSNEKYPFGSPRFVLIKHKVTLLKNPSEPDPAQWRERDVEFYSLYMHLDCTPSELGDVPWLQSFLPFLSRNLPVSGVLARVNVMEDGPVGGTAVGINCRQEPTKNESGKWVKGAVAAVLPMGTIVERGAERRDKYQQVNVPAMGLSSVWVYDEGNRLADVPSFTEQVTALQAGNCAKLDYPIEAGEVLGHTGLVKASDAQSLHFLATHGIHLEVFSTTNLVAAEHLRDWTLVEDDTDDDALCEFRALAEVSERLIPMSSLGWDNLNIDNHTQVQSTFRAIPPPQLQALRFHITRNTSFWSIDWKAMAARNAEWVDKFDFDSRTQECADRYSWWRECESKGVDIPSRTDGKALVYHYHPVALMEYLSPQLPHPPIFFVKRNAKQHVVTRPGDIVIDGDDPKKCEIVWVYEPGIPDWSLGKGATLQGCQGIGDYGETNLYQVLISPATTPGTPTLTDIDKHIWAAIWRSEGAIEALNTYDSAFLSFGPMQQTVGKPDSKGELQGALNYIKTKDSALFRKYFGQYNVDLTEVDDVENELVYGHIQLETKTLKTGTEKQVLRDFIWAYRCVKAMSDINFRRYFLEHGFKRIDIVRASTVKFAGTDVKLSDVFKTELALALLLDIHINLPAKLKSVWSKAVRQALGLSATAPLDTTTITQADEYKFIKEIINLRNSSGMWDPQVRAAYIVLCTKGLDGTLAQKLGYTDVASIRAAATGSKTTHLYGFLEHNR